LVNIKEIKRLRGGDLQVAAQVNVQIDAEIGQKDHFRIGTNKPIVRRCVAVMITQIYEIQTPAEAEGCLAAGVDHIGTVILSQEDFQDPVLREVSRIARAAGAKSSIIPLFDHEETLLRTIDYYQPDYLHFCEALVKPSLEIVPLEPVMELQARIKESAPQVAIIRSIPVPLPGRSADFPTLEIARELESSSDLFLIDTWLGRQPVEGFIGITGQVPDLELSRYLVWQSAIPVILAGGLSPDNVYDAVMSVSPAGADSCTWTNAAGKDDRPVRFQKDIEKVQRFVQEVRRAADALAQRRSAIENELERLKGELEERERALPAHSVRPHQLLAIEAVEEEIAARERELHGLRFIDL